MDIMSMIGFGAGGSVSVLDTLSLFGSATSTAQTIVAPASIVEGDLIVMLDRAEQLNATLPTLVTPTGFTSINNLAPAAYTRINLSYKLAAGTEGGATITGMVGTEYSAKAMYVFRGNIAASTITVGSVAGQVIDTDPTAQVVTASAGVAPLVVIGAYSVYTGAIDPRTFSTTKDGEIGPTTSMYLAYKIYNVSPADTTVDTDDNGAENSVQSCYIRVT